MSGFLPPCGGRIRVMKTPASGDTLACSLPLGPFMQEQVIARVDLPGASHADVSLQVHQTRLLISAGPEGAAQLLKHLEGDGHVVYRRDRGTGGFFRSLLLPGGIDVDEIRATMHDGVLVVTAPGKASGKDSDA